MDIADPQQRKARAAMEKKQALDAEKAKQQQEREALQVQCRCAMRPPPEFSEWGVIKTRAWRRCLRPIVRYAKSERPGLKPMRKALERLRNVLACEPDKLAAFAAGEKEIAS
jgi:hypothetical protein